MSAEVSAESNALIDRFNTFIAEHPVEVTPEPSDVESFDSDLVPQPDYSGGPHDFDFDLLNILDAYELWGGKNFKPEVGRKTEGIEIRCPSPDHLDEDPSAWISTTENAWFCGRCWVGGGPLQIAAARYGFATTGLRGDDFRRLRKLVLHDLGIGDSADSQTSAGSISSPIIASLALQPEAMIGLAGDVVRTIDPHTEADPAAVLMQFLVAFGNVIGRGPHFNVGETAHRTNLYAVLVGDTSKARKGTSWGFVKRLFAYVDADWCSKCISEGIVSGEGLVHAVRDARFERKTKAPKSEEQDDLVMIDPGVSDKRLLCKEEEFAAVLRATRRSENTASARVRQLWDTGDVRTLSKNNPDIASGAHVSIVGHITNYELQEALRRNEEANGFANRFLWCWVSRSKRLPRSKPIPDGSVRRLGVQIHERVAFAQDAGALDFDDEATALWESVYDGLSESRHGRLGAVTDRSEAQVVRLALIYAVLDMETAVRVPHLKAALAVWDYAEASARRIFGSNESGGDFVDRLMEAIKASGDTGLTRASIQKDVLSNHGNKRQIDDALARLTSTRQAHCVRESSNGRQTERWFAGPAN